MKTKIHNLKQYTQEEIDQFQLRFLAEKERQREYDEPGTHEIIAWVICWLVVVIAVGLLIYGWWQYSDRLLGL